MTNPSKALNTIISTLDLKVGDEILTIIDVTKQPKSHVIYLKQDKFLVFPNRQKPLRSKKIEFPIISFSEDIYLKISFKVYNGFIRNRKLN